MNTCAFDTSAEPLRNEFGWVTTSSSGRRSHTLSSGVTASTRSTSANVKSVGVGTGAAAFKVRLGRFPPPATRNTPSALVRPAAHTRVVGDAR